MAVQYLFWVAAAFFGLMSFRVLVCLRDVHRLPKLDGARTGDSLPGCSVVIAARDEEERIGQSIARLLEQEGVELEIIPVDDRSRDRTGVILKEISAKDARVKPKRVDLLPERWLGKCHACHVGAQGASREWLLFTDADCWLKPDVIPRAIAVAEREGVQHVTLTPGVTPETWAAAAWHISFLMSAADWIEGVNRDRPNRHLGVGAFNLVRADTYWAFGGHETLRLTVVDDVKLGRLVRKSGGRTRAFIGGDDAECHWGRTVRESTRIMEKNYFAAIDYRTALALSFVFMPFLWYGSLTAPAFAGPAGWFACLAVLFSAVPGIRIARLLGWSWKAGAGVPFVFPALFYAIVRSTVVTLMQGGIRWRNTFYPLDLLRRENVR